MGKVLKQIAVCFLLAILLSGCEKQSEVYTIESNETIEDKIATNKEPDRRISWNFDGAEAGDLKIEVFCNGEAIHESEDLTGEVPLNSDNSIYVLQVTNVTVEQLKVTAVIKYNYTGIVSTTAGTVTKMLKLE